MPDRDYEALGLESPADREERDWQWRQDTMRYADVSECEAAALQRARHDWRLDVPSAEELREAIAERDARLENI